MMMTGDLQFNMYCKQWESWGGVHITHIHKMFWLCYRSDKETYGNSSHVYSRKTIGVILNEVAVLKTGILCLINRVYDVTGCLQVHILAGARYFSPLRYAQTTSGAHPVSSSVGTEVLSWQKVAGV
jgi:hypothetical protein